MSSPGIKNILLHNSVNQNYNSARLVPTRGAYHDRHDTWGAGCGGRFCFRRAFCAWTNEQERTAKSCGPGAATLALSLAGSFSQGDGGKQARSPGEHEVSRKTIAWGKPGCFG